MGYDELETKGLTESLKCAASLAAVDGFRGREIKVMNLAKFGTYDWIYSRYVEPDGSKLFGFSFPKLSGTFEDILGKEKDTLQVTYTVNKWLYVVVLSWALSYTGIVGGFSKKQAYDFALAYALRAGVGFAMEDMK